MDRSVVAASATTGSLSALLLRLLSDLVSEQPLQCPLCPELEDLAWLQLDRLDPASLILGLLLGLLVGPVFDLIWVLRESWRDWVRNRVRQLAVRATREPLYKLA